MRSTRIVTWALAIPLLLALGAADASAQQRRRRPPARRPAPAAPAEPAASAETPAPEAGAEGTAPAPATTGPSPTAPAATTPPAPETAPGEPAAPATAEPAPPPTTSDDLPPPEDLSPLRAELEAVMNDLVEARARVAVIGRQLFDTKVVIRVRDQAGADNELTRFSLRLDGTPIHQGGADLGSRDSTKVFEGFAAPGPHLLTVELERRARTDEDFGVARTDSYRVVVRPGTLTEIGLVLDDDSDMAEGFADGAEGDYDVRVRMRVTARELGSEE